MKVIFLDFDGVMNSISWYKRRAELGLDKDLPFLQRSTYELDVTQVKMMSDFVIETGAAVVVSSSWRILHPIEELNEVVKLCGWEAPPFLDITPRSTKGFRGDEINAWLTDPTKRHVELTEPITHYVIFDDDSDFHPDQPFIHTTWERGLELHHIDGAREILAKLV